MLVEVIVDRVGKRSGLRELARLRPDDAEQTDKQAKIKEISDYCLLLSREDLPAQIMMLILRLCVLPSMQYHARTVPPRLFHRFARKFDEVIVKTITDRLHLPHPLPAVALEGLSPDQAWWMWDTKTGDHLLGGILQCSSGCCFLHLPTYHTRTTQQVPS